MTSITTADHPESDRARPILVTGSPRSGTTFVGRMLALSPEVHYIHEPFHPRFGPEVTAARFREFYTYLGDDSADAVLKPLARTMALHYDLGPALRRARRPADARRAVRQWHQFNRARRRGARALVKDPAALFSSEWLADAFQMKVIVLIRHPAAVAASYKRLGWEIDPRVGAFLSQPALVDTLLADHSDEIRVFASEVQPPLERLALRWKLMYHAVDQFRSRRPEWTYLRYEDLAAEPVASLRDVYRRFDLVLSAAAREQIVAMTSSANRALSSPDQWPAPIDSRASITKWRSMLSPSEIDTVRSIVQPVSDRFYGDADWG
jgi:hypothetical protein